MKEDELHFVACGFLSWVQWFDDGLDRSVAALATMIAAFEHETEHFDRAQFFQHLSDVAAGSADPRLRMVVTVLKARERLCRAAASG